MGSIPQQVRVCIVGAGVAGLGAAQKLIEAGIKDIVVLEAQDHIGGRLHTVPHGEHHLEFGAHWIHGEDGNVVYEWASENGLTESAASLVQTGIGETVFVRHNSEVVPDEVTERFQLVASRITESSETDLVDYPHSYGRYFLESFKKVNQWGKLGEELAEWQGRFQNCIDGTDSWFDSSGRGNTIYKECPGNPVVNWKDRGYQNLLDHLKETFPPSCIRLQTPVKCIDWNVALSNSRKGCVVHLESNEVIEASHVVFTPSLGVLKASAKKLFNPVPPADKLKAIEGLGIDVVDKIYLEFPNQWWPQNCDGFSLLHDLDSIPSSITEENWEYGVVGFYQVYKQPNMLCGWITGQAAKMMERSSEAVVSKRCVALLQKYLISNYQISDAVWCKRTSWGSNPWIRGAYSFRSVNTESMGVCAADLAKPLVDPCNNVPLVCFAGEATHDCYYSTVHGALESGWREAERLLQYFPSVCESSPIGPAMLKARDKYQVIVVGCGAAGIGAARELTSRGINSVLILEGSDRVGGRINTLRTGPQSHVDLGAQWVHGEVGNAVFKFAESRNLLYDFPSVDGKGDFYTENGTTILDDTVEEVMTVLNKADEEMQKMSDASVRLSVGEFFKRRFFEYLASCKHDTYESIKLKIALYEWYVRWQRVDNACDSLQTLSAHCWGRYIFCEGNENTTPKQGFSSIIEALLKETKADVILNSEVNCIDYARSVKMQGNRCVRTDGATLPVVVKCRNGREFEAENVVVTPSLGYLKQHLNIFSPALPENLQKAIVSTGFGTIDKIFLEFEDPFWSEDCEGIHLVWTNNIPNYERLSPVTSSVTNSEDMRKCWFQAITGFDPVPHQRAMLCGWICGAEAEYMETLSENEVGRTCVNLLRQFMGREDIPYPKNVYRSQWATNKFICGSYSYHTVPCNCRFGGSNENELNVPVCAVTEAGEKVPLLVLAGEANSTAYYSTVHGALQNGMSQVAHYLKAVSRLNGGNDNIRSKI